MKEKQKLNQDVVNFLFNDKMGRKVLIIGGVIVGIYASTFVMRGAARAITSFKELKQAIKS
tara:strand:+ start:175 stop:357 length:183 start_codon:yes stop_codon:yes gene_type:complete